MICARHLLRLRAKPSSIELLSLPAAVTIYHGQAVCLDCLSDWLTDDDTVDGGPS